MCQEEYDLSRLEWTVGWTTVMDYWTRVLDRAHAQKSKLMVALCCCIMGTGSPFLLVSHNI